VLVIPCKWVFKTKLLKNDAGLEVQKYKARPVSKGYSQIHGVDYEETFAPVVKFTSIRVLLAMVTHFDSELHQMDVVTALHNFLKSSGPVLPATKQWSLGRKWCLRL
jgi:Reverse transcriptase (RNA-dependent DNA polymerase)